LARSKSVTGIGVTSNFIGTVATSWPSGGDGMVICVVVFMVAP
jgi:hypothetical protein